MVATGHTKTQAAHLMHISKPTVACAKTKQQLYGDIEGRKMKTGRRSKFMLEIIDVLNRIPLFLLANSYAKSLFE